MDYTDAELLKMVGEERRRAIGFDDGTSEGADLTAERSQALEYIKGEMGDVPSLPGRSKVTSSDVADTVETILPDLVEIFTGGEDVVAFNPTGEEDVEASEQETDFIRHIFFNENHGFMNLYAMFKDALEVKTGVLKWWKEEEKSEPTTYEGQTQVAALMVAQELGIEGLDDPRIISFAESKETDETGAPLYDFTIESPPRTKICIAAVPPNDFAVANDTVRLGDTAYCAHKTRPRAQSLLAQGVAQEIVDELPPSSRPDEREDRARDSVGENEFPDADGGELRIVEVVEHYIRLIDDGKLCYWRIQTGADETVLISKDKVNGVPFSAITPYVITHRFYGQSVADKMMEIQRIKTVLKRGGLDSMYFALNQRNEVAMAPGRANEYTIADLLRNEPGVPIRSTDGQSVRPISAGGLNFDVFGGLEYFSTVGEQRSGVVRNAQGLNPDTLHDTAKGAQVLMNAAQKRVRLIARIFAEMGLKDAFLGIHSLIREGGFHKAKVRLRNKWVDIDPTQWGERSDMSIEVGLGSSGKDQDLLVMAQVLDKQAAIIAAQGFTGLVSADNAYNALTRFAKLGGIKATEKYFTDPATLQPQEPKQDPAVMEAQAKLAMQQQEQQQTQVLKQQEAASNAALARETAERQHQLAVDKQNAEIDLKDRQLVSEIALKERQLVSELALSREVALASVITGQATPVGQTSEVNMGGEPG